MKLDYHDYVNRSENTHRNYRMFNTSTYFAEITKGLNRSIVDCIDKPRYSVGPSLTLSRSSNVTCFF